MTTMSESKDRIEDAPEHLRERVLSMKETLVERYKCPAPVSIAGARCALLLQEWLGGFHHMPPKVPMRSINWNDWSVIVPSKRSGFYPGMDSFDGSGMTRLVLLAHEHVIRAELQIHYDVVLHLSPRSVNGTHPCVDKHRSLVELRDEINEILAQMERAR